MKPVPAVPGPGQESVWAYPRPPRLEADTRPVEVWLGGMLIASTSAQTGPAYRVLETSHPPGFYLPPGAFIPGSVQPAAGSSVCEWKGRASYWTLLGGGRRAETAAWSYQHPTPEFLPIAGYLALYAGRVDRVLVGGVEVVPQPGDFYGGWITPEVVGPFKGGPGSWGW